MEKKKNMGRFLKGLSETGLFPMYLISLISADTLLTVEDCNRSEAELLELQEAIPDSEIEKKEYWLERVGDSLKIVRENRKIFEKALKDFKKRK